MYLPQLTTGPSAVAWSPDSLQLDLFHGRDVVAPGTLRSAKAEQLTAGPGV